MDLQKQLRSKVNGDFIKFQARTLNYTKMKIFNAHERIRIAIDTKEFLDRPNIMFDSDCYQKMLGMNNIIDEFYRSYKNLQKKYDGFDMDDVWMKTMFS